MEERTFLSSVKVICYCTTEANYAYNLDLRVVMLRAKKIVDDLRLATCTHIDARRGVVEGKITAQVEVKLLNGGGIELLRQSDKDGVINEAGVEKLCQRLADIYRIDKDGASVPDIAVQIIKTIVKSSIS